jgi:hypothetical protein
MSWFKQTRWSPYVVGGLIGVLSWFAFASADKALGVSTTFVRGVGLAEQVFVPSHVEGNAYFQKTGIKVNWQWLLVVGIFLGALASARLSGDHRVEKVPGIWRDRFGPSVPKRYAIAFLGGALVLFGARLAGGCTSGHGISGSLQLALSGWTFFFTIFVTGVLTTMALFGRVKTNV